MTFYLAQIASTISLLVVALACVAHLSKNISRLSKGGERWGFVLTGAGAFGQAVYAWWPKFESFPFSTLMHIGMALIAVSLVRGQLIGWIGNPPGFHFFDRWKNENHH